MTNRKTNRKPTSNRHYSDTEVATISTGLVDLIEGNLMTEMPTVRTMPGRGINRRPVFEIKILDCDGDIEEDAALRNDLIDLIMATGRFDTVLMGSRGSAAPADVKVAGFECDFGLCKILVAPTV